jgi:hypothetical protein
LTRFGRALHYPGLELGIEAQQRRLVELLPRDGPVGLAPQEPDHRCHAGRGEDDDDSAPETVAVVGEEVTRHGEEDRGVGDVDGRAEQADRKAAAIGAERDRDHQRKRLIGNVDPEYSGSPESQNRQRNNREIPEPVIERHMHLMMPSV